MEEDEVESIAWVLRADEMAEGHGDALGRG